MDHTPALSLFRAMWMTVKFTNVYDGEEHIKRATIEVEAPPAGADIDDLDDWAYDNLHPHSGDGKAVRKDAGYFAEIIACADRPELVGGEFTWGV